SRNHHKVALLASAWIETRNWNDKGRKAVVALLASAWIETRFTKDKALSWCVALLASAWIETDVGQKEIAQAQSRSSRARGLKPMVATSTGTGGGSRSSRARGLKLCHSLLP